MVRELIKPDTWQADHWREDNCSIEPTTTGEWAIIDHQIQECVACADTLAEARRWLGRTAIYWLSSADRELLSLFPIELPEF